MVMRMENRMRSDAPRDSSLSESRGKSLSKHQVIHANDASTMTRGVANRPIVPVRNRMLSSTGGLGMNIPIEPNQIKRRFVGAESAFDRRARVSSGIINSVHSIGK